MQTTNMGQMDNRRPYQASTYESGSGATPARLIYSERYKKEKDNFVLPCYIPPGPGQLNPELNYEVC